MKKIVFLLPLLLLLTGCGSQKVTCTATMTEENEKYELKIVADIKDNKINSGSIVMKFENKDTADQFCSLYEAINSLAEDDKKIDYKCNGNEVTFSSLEFLEDGEEEEEKVIGMTKDDFVKKFQEEFEGGTCK